MHAVHPELERPRPMPVPAGVVPRVAVAAGPGRDPSRELLLSVLDEVNHGLLLVNETADVRYANRAALRDCAAGSALHFDGRRLRVWASTDREDLLQALSAARRGRRSMLTLRTERHSTAVGIVPLQPHQVEGDAVALLVLGRREECDPLNLQFFAQMHRLTAAESAVLNGLCEGLRPSQVAERGGVALSTVRSQIDSIRQKTRARGVHDVVRMVQMLPPVVSALHDACAAWPSPAGGATLRSRLA